MVELWFAGVAPPTVRNPNPTCEYAALHDADGGLWATLQQPVEPQQLAKQDEINLVPELLLRGLDMGLRSSDISDARMFPSSVDILLPLALQGVAFPGGPACMKVLGRAVLTYSLVVESSRAHIAIVNDRWLLVLHPAGISQVALEV